MGDVLYSEGQAERTGLALQGTPQRQPKTPAAFIFEWYTRRQGRFWCLSNIFATGLVIAIVAEAINRTLLISWCMFLFLNSILLLNFHTNRSANPDADKQKTDDSILFFAAIFGGAWGVLLFITGNHLAADQYLLLQLLVLSIAAAAIPYFALSKGAFSIFFAVLLIPCVAINQSLEDTASLKIFFILMFMLYLAAAYFAAAQREIATALEKVLILGSNNRAFDETDKQSLQSVVEKCIRRIARRMPDAGPASEFGSAVGDGIITIDSQGYVEQINPIAEVLIGITHDNAYGQNLHSVLNIKGRDAAWLLSIACTEEGQPTEIRSQETLIRSDGIEYSIEFVSTAHLNEFGQHDGTSFILRELPATKPLSNEFTWKTGHDPLTQLFNRMEFETRLNNLFRLPADEKTKSHAICVIDLDDFQYINESQGHKVGDQALIALAREFKTKIRGADVLARIGDHKFGVLLIACDHDKARMIAEGLRHIAQQTNLTIDENSVDLSVSIGLVAFKAQNDSLSDILIAAEIACTNAKKDGGNRVFSLRDTSIGERTIGEGIAKLRGVQSALRNNKLLLQVQPIHASNRPYPTNTHALHTDTSRLSEILLRMENEHGGLSAPREILAASERFQLMAELDRWATNATLNAVRANHPALGEFDSIFINISGQSLNNDEFTQFILAELEYKALPTHRLCFVISHASLIASIDRAAQFIASLQEYECKVALNDIGFSNDAFALLKCLPVDYLKIDSRFVRNMIHNSVDYEIVLGIVRISKTLKISTIATGVDTVALKETLTGMGVDFVQGLAVAEAEVIETRRSG